MDVVFVILVIILCVLIAYYIRFFRSEIKIITSGTKYGSSEEIEARWLDINIDDMRKKIEELGGELVHDEKQYRRYVFGLGAAKNIKVEGSTMSVDGVSIKTKNTEKECQDFAKAVISKEDGYVRTREEYRGDEIVVTITCKLYSDASKHADEYELTIDGTLEDGKKFLEAAGLSQKAYHETRRIKYIAPDNNSLQGVKELVIDTIPGMPPYIEVEATSEKAMFETAKALGLEKGMEHYGPYGKTFADVYGFTQEWFDNLKGDGLKELTFKTFVESMMPHVTKNKDMFEKVVNSLKI